MVQHELQYQVLWSSNWMRSENQSLLSIEMAKIRDTHVQVNGVQIGKLTEYEQASDATKCTACAI